ncbi:EpsG family protein [Ruminococcus sp. YRD2003]|uniref:EpsG family protein n=1 Tax=Ruminococcus sp. YRD2003 TaxID=1452313 RepID=UPI0008D019F1|nr:EpsG family protein [Ruminococcus flavefaciens]
MIRLKKEMYLRKIKYLAIVSLAVLFSMTFHVTPFDNMDFVRHSNVMDYIKITHISLQKFLENAAMLNKNETSSGTYVFNVIEYFFAKHFSNNYTLVWFLTALDYSAIAYIAYDYKKTQGYKLCEVFFAVILCFSFLPFVHVVSGLRTACAMCLTALGIYLLYFKKSYCISCLLFIASSLIHSLIIIPCVVAIAVYFFPYKSIVTMFGVAFLFVNSAIAIISRVNIPFLSLVVIKYKRYTGDRQFVGYKFPYYGAILLCVIFLFYYFYFYTFKTISKNADSKIDNKLINLNCFQEEKNNMNKEKMYLFFATYCVVIIGNFKGHEFVHRLSYMMGCFAPILSSCLFEKRVGGDKPYVALFTRIMLYGLLFIMISLNIFHYYRFFV